MARKTRKSSAASNVNDGEWSCEYCGKAYSNKHSFDDHCRASPCAVAHRGASMWRCHRCGMRSAHRRSTAKHMKDRCWEKCDECAEAGLDRCDAAKGESDCTNCRGREVACTKPPQGQVTTGGPTEVKSTGTVQSTQAQQEQQDGPQNAPDPRPRRLLRSRQDYAYSEDLDYEVTGSDSEEDPDEYEQDGEDSHDTRGHVPSNQNDSPADAGIVEADKVLDNAESTEPRLATDDTISSNATNQSQEHDLATTQAQSRQDASHPGRSARRFFLNIDTAPGHPRIENPPTNGTAPRSASTALSAVDEAFLSNFDHQLQEQTQTASSNYTRPRIQLSAPETAPSASHPPPSAPLTASTTLPRSSSSGRATATLPQAQTPIPFPIYPSPYTLPSHTHPTPPWWTSVPEIASMMAAHRRMRAPYGLSNDFTEFYSHVLETTDNMSRKKKEGKK